MVHYCDTSALVKLVTAEAETLALRAWLSEARRELISSDVTRTELMRAVRRAAPELAQQARLVLDSIDLIRVSTADFDAAGRLDPVDLRSLDALHLTMAMRLGDDLESLVTYDERLARAAAQYGVGVSTPG